MAMRAQEWEKVDDELFLQYRAAFGMMDTFTMPPMAGPRLNDLMREALRAGTPIDYLKEGWEDVPSDAVI